MENKSNQFEMSNIDENKIYMLEWLQVKGKLSVYEGISSPALDLVKQKLSTLNRPPTAAEEATASTKHG